MARDELASRRKSKQARTDAARALRTALEGGYDRSGKNETPLTRKVATEYHEETGSWMHPFADVRKDNAGFYILREDNPDGWRMQPGDLIQDAALNQTPYWQVTANDQERVDLEPIEPNPLLTGVGAGGYVFHANDFKVLTGEYERERVGKLMERLESGEQLQIYDVKYLLTGTVPLNFGPNGPQGGWYNCQDTYSNRGRGKTSEEVVHADAEMLVHMGFELPDAALTYDIEPGKWNEFIENPAQRFADWMEVPPYDLDLLLERYAKAPWLRDSDRGHDDIVEGMRDYFSRRVKRDHWKLFALPGEDDWTLADWLGHAQEEVQMRGVSRAIMTVMSTPSGEFSSTIINGLWHYLRAGEGSLSVYDRLLEKVGQFFPTEVAVPLLVEGAQSNNGYVRGRAYRGLALHRYKKLPNFVFKERDGEALKEIADGLREFGYMPGREVVDHLIKVFVDILGSGSVYGRYYASDGIVNLRHLARKQGLDIQYAMDAVDAYNESVRRNPDDAPTRHGDDDWFAITLDVMTEVIS